ncbi:sigma-70 family RNA polymerase sigma factor [Nostoc linckia FACHB-104]|nr:sigma-70 family RNA polymerase sigma factor [Nostoc linckia FACHB-104]
MTTQPNTDESGLLAKIAQQDQTAMAQLYDRYAGVLYGVAFKILGTVEEAEEAVLDVFQQVWRTAGRYDASKSRVDTWLFMQIRSRALDKLRAKQRIARTASISLDAVDLDTPSLITNPTEDVVILERRTQVIAAIKQLPLEQRQVVELAYFQGLTHAEIANQTGVALGTIKTRIRLALNKLRSSLADLAADKLGYG